MKQNVFTKSIQILIVTLLLLAVLLPKEYTQKGMILALFLWSVFSLISFFYSRKKTGTIKNPFRRNHPVTMDDIPCEDAKEVLANLEDTSPTRFFLSETEVNTILLHLALRITEKMKSAYPNAVWQWMERPDLSEILSGTSVRVSVEEMSNYTHADIAFDRFGKIHITPMIIGNFAESAQAKDQTKEESPKEPAVVDVRAWYELVGQHILENHITELNANGHSKLTIKENGDLVINRHKKESLVATLNAFPGKTYWNELITIFEENELHAKITGNTLQLSWI